MVENEITADVLENKGKILLLYTIIFLFNYEHKDA